MEVINVIEQLIGSVGFPIVAYLLMYRENKKLIEALDKIGDKWESTDKRLGKIERKLNIETEE